MKSRIIGYIVAGTLLIPSAAESQDAGGKGQVPEQATVDGDYSKLLRTIKVPQVLLGLAHGGYAVQVHQEQQHVSRRTQAFAHVESGGGQFESIPDRRSGKQTSKSRGLRPGGGEKVKGLQASWAQIWPGALPIRFELAVRDSGA
jgi:hypothetical protein